MKNASTMLESNEPSIPRIFRQTRDCLIDNILAYSTHEASFVNINSKFYTKFLQCRPCLDYVPFLGDVNVAEDILIKFKDVKVGNRNPLECSGLQNTIGFVEFYRQLSMIL